MKNTLVLGLLLTTALHAEHSTKKARPEAPAEKPEIAQVKAMLALARKNPVSPGTPSLSGDFVAHCVQGKTEDVGDGVVFAKADREDPFEGTGFTHLKDWSTGSLEHSIRTTRPIGFEADGTLIQADKLLLKTGDSSHTEMRYFPEKQAYGYETVKFENEDDPQWKIEEKTVFHYRFGKTDKGLDFLVSRWAQMSKWKGPRGEPHGIRTENFCIYNRAKTD